MAVVLPRFLNIDGEYGANDLGWPFRFLVTEGVCGIGDLRVTQNGTPNMSVNVAAGRAFILGDDNPDTQPNYLFYNDATVNLAVPAADPTNPRIDIVVAEVRDSTFGGAADDGRLRVITGTPAGSPSAPATPDNCLKLAELSIPAGDTTITTDQITDTRPVAQPGGELVQQGKLVIVCTTDTRPGDPDDGQPIWDTTLNQFLVWNETAGAWAKVSAKELATSVSALGTPAPGRIAQLRIGTTPYDFVSLTYDDTYGKWVSPVFTVAAAGGGGVSTSPEVIAVGALKNYKAHTDAGLRLMLHMVSAATRPAGGGSSTNIALHVSGYDGDDSSLTAINNNLISHTHALAATSYIQSDWATAGVSASQPHAVVRVVATLSTAGTAGDCAVTVMGRWVSA